MSISPIASLPSSAAPAEVQKTAPTPTPASTAAPQDTVSISPKGQQASSSGDVDHDGDSH